VNGWARRLQRERRGGAGVEFALCLPVLMLLGMYGAEVAYMQSVNMQVSQLAISVADNASRLGQTDNSSVSPTITEIDVDAVMLGAIKQGDPIRLSQRGRIILSSLEKDAATGKQYIHWQRCRGSLARSSAYGNDTTNNGLTGTAITGLGSGSQQLAAASGSAVMFAEVYYQYQGLFGTLYTQPVTMKREAAFVIRDARNLTTGLTGGNSQSPCS
jgi:Flp pilus assembly protein TadG